MGFVFRFLLQQSELYEILLLWFFRQISHEQEQETQNRICILQLR